MELKTASQHSLVDFRDSLSLKKYAWVLCKISGKLICTPWKFLVRQFPVASPYFLPVGSFPLTSTKAGFTAFLCTRSAVYRSQHVGCSRLQVMSSYMPGVEFVLLQLPFCWYNPRKSASWSRTDLTGRSRHGPRLVADLLFGKSAIPRQAFSRREAQLFAFASLEDTRFRHGN